VTYRTRSGYDDDHQDEEDDDFDEEEDEERFESFDFEDDLQDETEGQDHLPSATPLGQLPQSKGGLTFSRYVQCTTCVVSFCFARK
jgi:hypothetical protein